MEIKNIINYYNLNGEWCFKSTFDKINDISIYDITGKLIKKEMLREKLLKSIQIIYKMDCILFNSAEILAFKLLKFLNKN